MWEEAQLSAVHVRFGLPLILRFNRIAEYKQKVKIHDTIWYFFIIKCRVIGRYNLISMCMLCTVYILYLSKE